MDGQAHCLLPGTRESVTSTLPVDDSEVVVPSRCGGASTTSGYMCLRAEGSMLERVEGMTIQPIPEGTRVHVAPLHMKTPLTQAQAQVQAQE
mgnify:FL=1